MKTLGENKAAEMADYLTRLFPRWKPTPEQLSAFRSPMARTTLEEEQVRAILSNSSQTGKSFPDLQKIWAQVHEAVRQQTEIHESTAVKVVTAAAQTDPNSKTMNEWCYLHKRDQTPWYRGLPKYSRHLVDVKASLWAGKLAKAAGDPNWRDVVKAEGLKGDPERGGPAEIISRIVRDAAIKAF